MLRREFVRVLATLRKPETVPKMLEVKVVALDSEQFRMKSLKKDVKSAQENSERRYDSAKLCESLCQTRSSNFDAICEPCLRRVTTEPRMCPCELEADGW